MKIQLRKYKIFSIILMVVVILPVMAQSSYGQMTERLEDRVRALENYVDTFQPTLLEFSSGFEQSIRQYTQQLETSLQSFSTSLEQKLDERLSKIEHKKAYFDPRSNAYQHVMTRSGMFLIAVKKMTSIGNGVRLALDIGNPNYADYKDFTLKLVWGSPPPVEGGLEYQRWQSELVGAQFTFNGSIDRGVWNEIEIDLVPADYSNFGYLEVEMDVASVELQHKKY